MVKPLQSSASSDSSEFWGSDDPAFLEALGNAVLPGDEPSEIPAAQPCAESQSRKRSRDESDELQAEMTSHVTVAKGPGDSEEDPEIYGASRFGHFGEYMRRKRAKLQIQNANLEASQDVGGKSKVFSGLSIYVCVPNGATREGFNLLSQINGWTNPSVQDLRQLIVTHGGVFQPYLDRKSLVSAPSFPFQSPQRFIAVYAGPTSSLAH